MAANDPAAAQRSPCPECSEGVTPTPALATARVNLLHNGDFEGDSARQWSSANDEWVNGRVAEGWTAWWRKPTPSDGEYPAACPEGKAACVPWHRPEYRETRSIPYDPPRVRTGENSQMVFTSFGVYEGGLYQTVSGVPRGWSVRFSIWAKAWSSDAEDTAESAGQPSMGMRAGIDPTGGTDPWSDAVVWSKESDSFDAFGEYGVSAVAQADRVTVFFRSQPERALKHVDVMLDDAELILIGPPPPTPVVIRSPNESASAPTRVPATDSLSQQIVVHVVQPGDTLFAIAQAYRVELSDIYALNGLNETSVLKVGQSIRISLAAQTPPTAVPAPYPGRSPDPGSDPERREGEEEREGAAEEPALTSHSNSNSSLEGGAPAAVGTLCVRAFEDVAGDTLYNQGDGAPSPALSFEGAAFIVADASGRTVAASTPALSFEGTARCFDGLPAGAYAVSAQAPAGYTATTNSRWGVSLIEGARVEVAVGIRRAGEPAGEDAGEVLPMAMGVTAGLGCLAAIILLIRRRTQSSRATRDT
ncbi:MAG TPA: LysM peptidoglycan-binding domain-containing protein [Anaerolineae bacterium]|nr:LysM peptidoglycan-binding domain-containing protein [Anaerolineae bacterium]